MVSHYQILKNCWSMMSTTLMSPSGRQYSDTNVILHVKCVLSCYNKPQQRTDAV